MKIDHLHLRKNLYYQQVVHYLKINIKFSWKDDVYVYGLLDGFNGPLAVDMFNEYLLVDLVFEDFESKNSVYYFLRISKNYVLDKNDFEIFEMIDSQILKTESKLEQYLSDKLSEQTIGVHDPQERERLDREISSGLFLSLSFIIRKKIFTVSVGESVSFNFGLPLKSMQLEF
jgi:hypothetical protein